MGDAGADVVAELRRASIGRGDLVAIACAPRGLGLVTSGGGVSIALATDVPAAIVQCVEQAVRPRWVWWSSDTAATLVAAGVRVATCWDLAAVHRLVFGGWRADPATVWAHLQDLDPDTVPTSTSPDLFSAAEHDDGGFDDPIGDDGHLRPGWADGAWRETPTATRRWAGLAATAAARQQDRLTELGGRRAVSTAWSESAAELLCAELSADGLPMDRATAERIVASSVGIRPRSPTEEIELRRRRDAAVLRHAPPGTAIDLRSPGQVRSLLRRVGVEVADTRAWRLEALRDSHPLVDALLAWRKAERIATTYGYAWLDEHLDRDGRLRGRWSGSDGAAGRMTATAGLHNMPADLRAAVVAEPGHVFVRADLGQIEPRVLAAISGDAQLTRATGADDMYAPVAAQLGVDRPTAKVAMLAAMYGQTTGHGAHALRRLESAYPVAMDYLRQAEVAGQVSRPLRTFGGRRILMGSTNANEIGETEARRRAAARGRYGRNAVVQGAAAELFKAWAVTVRARVAGFGAVIVLCLHDELLLHVPGDHGEAVARRVDECLREATGRWAPDAAVRFVVAISIVTRWSDAKR